MLQEALQKGTQGKVTYRTIGESGLEHNKVFEVEVLVDDVPKNKGTGHSKKVAEQNAAHTLLKSMGIVQFLCNRIIFRYLYRTEGVRLIVFFAINNV